MSKIIAGGSHNSIPWQDKPEGYKYPVWRYDGNPIITRDNLFMANSIFNSAVVAFGKGFAGVFRVDLRTRDQVIVTGFSDDGINWKLNEKVIFEGYDPRICKIDDKYYLSWVKLTPKGTVIGIAYTRDFESWTELEEACYPVARNGVLFPRKINDEYMLLVRPCDRGHTPYGDIFIQRSKDLEYWGKYRFVMSPVKNWEMTKIGAGPRSVRDLRRLKPTKAGCFSITVLSPAATVLLTAWARQSLTAMSPGRFFTGQTATCLPLMSPMRSAAMCRMLFFPALPCLKKKAVKSPSITALRIPLSALLLLQLMKP